MWWLERLGNAQRLRPCWKDASQMLQDGADLRSWIRSALHINTPPSCQIVADVPPLTAQTPIHGESIVHEDFVTTYHRLRTAKRVSTPAGPGVIFPYTSLQVQIRRRGIGVLLDQSIHSSGRLLEYFLPHEVQRANTSKSERDN